MDEVAELIQSDGDLHLFADAPERQLAALHAARRQPLIELEHQVADAIVYVEANVDLRSVAVEQICALFARGVRLGLADLQRHLVIGP